jgi:hypothetical protein
MKNTITTNVTLPADEDRVLKIKAAEVGLSKRNLATQITREWIEAQGIKSRISDMITRIAQMPSNEKYFKAIEDLTTASTKLTECRVKRGIAEDFGYEYSMANKEAVARGKVVASLDLLKDITEIPKIDPDVFSALFIEDYFRNRSR